MEKAILVGLDLGNDEFFQENLEELRSLALACNIEVLDEITQKKSVPTPNFYIGEGRADDLKDLIEELDANVVIFDDELSPSHIRNLEEKLKVKVIDRTVLILDIFARRAKTKEAILQVLLAQSIYMLPRVIGMNKSLSRQRSGTGSKGPGEQQLELDRRLLREKISQYKRELKELVKVRRNQRGKRNKSLIKTVALTGYTNSGKSTLMNAIIKETDSLHKYETLSKDMLFATLETKTKKIVLSNNHDFLLTDTVGFIRKLPHDLIEAFKSTLEEIKEASLILHVVDLANPNYEHQIQTVEDILSDIGVKDIPIIYVFNKIDLLSEVPIISRDNAILISAESKTNINKLIDLINLNLYKTHTVKMLIPFADSAIYSDLKENTNIIKTNYLENGIEIEANISDYFYHKYHNFIN
jgi:GTP-binding protein HflX